MKTRPVSVWEIEKYFWRGILSEPWLVLSSLLFAPAIILRNVVTPLIVAIAFSSLAKGGRVGTGPLVLAAGAFALSILLEHFAAKTETEMNIRVNQRLYQRCFEWLVRQDYGFYTNQFVGSLVALSNRFVKANEFHTFLVFTEIIGMLASVVTALGVMVFYNAAIGLAAALVWAISVYIAGVLAIRRIPTRRQAVAADSRQTGALADAVTNALAIKTFAQEENEARRYDKGNRVRADKYRVSWDLAIRNGTWMRIFAATLQMTVFIGGVVAIQSHSITLATFLLFQVYILMIINSIFQSQQIVRNLEGIYGDAGEMMEMFRQEQLVIDQDDVEPSQIKEGHIVLDNISFGYAEGAASNELFKGLFLDIKPGEKVGLVGPSGGGKTTITKLLLRFVDPDEGSISIDGQRIQAIRQADLHEVISYVPQEPLLFHRSLQENIAYAKPTATNAEIEAAAKLAHAHDFIKDLPKGYETLVGERGVKLSGGQRQRVALARTILKSSPIIVLDEPTSALDSESEFHVQEALWNLMKDKTSVVIAHRLSTIKHLDRIIVLDEGKIIEQGTHDELLGKKGMYAKLWAHQSDGFIR